MEFIINQEIKIPLPWFQAVVTPLKSEIVPREINFSSFISLFLFSSVFLLLVLTFSLLRRFPKLAT
jgi:hypothetical protein